MSPSSKFFAIVVGAGSGTGRAAALRFAQSYPVALLSRSADSHKPIVDEITSSGGQALGVATDATDRSSVDAAFAAIKRQWPDHKLAAAVYNAGETLEIKGFLEQTEKDLARSLGTAVNGLFHFAQNVLPLLLTTVSSTPPHPPTLIVTGATASIRGSARFSTFAAGKFAQRALTQSLAREFGPKGVHVALAIIDGVIDIPRTKKWTANDGAEDGKLNPDAIAESYWNLHTQHRSAFTQELDLRPYVEKF